MSIRNLIAPGAGDALNNLYCNTLNYTTLNPDPIVGGHLLTDTTDTSLSAGYFMVGVSGHDCKQSTIHTVGNSIILPAGGDYEIGSQPVLNVSGSVITIGTTAVTNTKAYTLLQAAAPLNAFSMNIQCGADDLPQIYALNGSTAIDFNLGKIGGGAQNVNLESGSVVKINSAEKLSATQLNAQNAFPTNAGQLAIIGSKNYVYFSQDYGAAVTTSISIGIDTQIKFGTTNISYTLNINKFTMITSTNDIVGFQCNYGGKYKVTFILYGYTTNQAQNLIFKIYKNSTPLTNTGRYFQIGANASTEATITYVGDFVNNDLIQILLTCEANDAISCRATQVIIEEVNTNLVAQ